MLLVNRRDEIRLGCPLLSAVSIQMPKPVHFAVASALLGGLFAQGCGQSKPIANLIPMPVKVALTGSTFTLDATSGSAIYVDSGSPELTSVGTYLQSKLQPSTGYPLTVTPVSTPPKTGIYLTTAGGDPSLGTEGYLLTVTPNLVTLAAYTPTGVFRGVQTIRQMLPPAIEKSTREAGPWTMATGSIRDYPRWAWRGSMLDVARRFFSVAVVERYIDEMAYFKLNTFHLHLSDNQGWRIQINGWEKLTGNTPDNGSFSEVGNASCTDCFYTQADYSALVAYAKARYITLIPEIDGPGHINAALHAYGSLTCSGAAPPADTDRADVTTSLCTTDPSSYVPFMTAVVTQISALTDGTYFHIGGDEVDSTATAAFEQTVKPIVEAATNANGEHMKLAGWEEIAVGSLSRDSVVQHWKNDSLALLAVEQGATVVMSPPGYCYLNERYGKNSPGKLDGTRLVNTQTAYSWDPNALVMGVNASAISGLEAPLWTPDVPDQTTLDQMAYPRLAGHAEIGWSATSGSSVWSNYAARLGSFGSRFAAQGIEYYPDAGIDWH